MSDTNLKLTQEGQRIAKIAALVFLVGLTGVILSLFFSTLLSFILGAVVGVLAVISWAMLKTDTQSDQQQAQPESGGEPIDVEAALTDLMQLNISVRSHDLPDDLIDRIEEVIDSVGQILNDLDGQFGDHYMTKVWYRIAREHLPNPVETYIELDHEYRTDERREELEDALQALEKEIERTRKKMRRKKQDEFQQEASRLEAVYLE